MTTNYMDEFANKLLAEIQTEMSLESQAKEVLSWLESIPELSGSGTLLERCQRVMIYYASQGGRWVRKQEVERTKRRRLR